MPNKKKNPYIYFCLEKRASDPKYHGKSVKEMVQLCNEEWSAMGPDQRRPYMDTADELSRGQTEPSSHNEQNDMAGKFDSFGCSMKAKLQAKLQERGLFELMREDISRFVKSDDVGDFRFHIMAAHSWLKIDSSTYDLIPVEIALLEMSLKKGVMRKWLQFIDPGEVPAAYKAEMKLNSEKYHEIWLDNVELTDAYGDIVNKIIEVLSAKDNERYVGKGIEFHADVDPPFCLISSWKRRLLPIFCLKADIPDVRKMLAWLIKQSKIEVDFVIYELEYLFQQMMVTNPINPSKMTIGAAEAHLLRDIFLYLDAMSCKYHRDLESCNCAGARVSRFAYVMTDFCCQLYGIMPKEGGHIPKGIAVNSIVVPPSQYPSFLDETESVHELSFVADKALVDASKMEDIPEACRTKQEFPLGTSFHMLGPMWVRTPRELRSDLNARQEYLSVDEFFERHGVQDFDFDSTGLTGLDASIFYEPVQTSKDQSKEESGANDSFSFLDKFFDDPTVHPVLKANFDWEPGKKLTAPLPDPFYDTRF